MFTKVKVLIWERWQRTRWAVIWACLLTLIERLMPVAGFIDPDRVASVSMSFSGTGTAILLFVLIGGHCELRNLDLRFPERLFRLPVRTTTLFGTYLGYGVAALALPTLIHYGFFVFFSEPINSQRIAFSWNGLLMLETVYMALQTLSWLGGLRGYVLCLVPSLIFLFALPFLADRFCLSLSTNAMCWIIILLCGIISFWNVSADRHGAWIKGRQWTVPFLGLFRRKPPKPFASALQAQIWFETRQTGYLFPVAVLCIICPLLIAAIFIKPSSSVLSLFPIAFFATIALAMIAGFLAFGVYHREHASGASGFWLRRPMDTQALVLAKLRAMIRSITRGLAILTVFVLVLVVRDWAFGTLDVTYLLPAKWALSFSSPIEAIPLTVSALCCLAVICWILMRMPVMMLIVTQTFWLGVNVAKSWRWETLFTYLDAVIFVGVLIAFYVARRRSLISKATMSGAACLFVVVAAALWGFPWWLRSKGLPDLNQSQSILVISLAVLPFIPVVATPLLMDKLRHR